MSWGATARAPVPVVRLPTVFLPKITTLSIAVSTRTNSTRTSGWLGLAHTDAIRVEFLETVDEQPKIASVRLFGTKG